MLTSTVPIHRHTVPIHQHGYSAVKDAVLGDCMEVQQPVQVHVTSIVSMSLKSTVFGTCLYNTEIDFTVKNAVLGTSLYNTEIDLTVKNAVFGTCL